MTLMTSYFNTSVDDYVYSLYSDFWTIGVVEDEGDLSETGLDDEGV